MKQATTSRTAELTAIMRAIHQTADEEPKILADSIAPRLVGAMGDDDEWHARILQHPFAREWRTGFLIRNRYAEDCLAERVDQGLQQYAILGAGLDTFAFRQPSWARSLRIYEIDHLATQRWKCDLLAAAHITVPSNVEFVPADFERASLADALSLGNFDFASKTFCSWLGVTQYLTHDAIRRTLEFVLSLPQSSEIVFSFILPSEALMMAASRCAEIGEPWRTTYRADDLEARLRAMGFSNVIRLTPEKAYQLYLKDRRDGLQARHGEQLIRAVV